MLPWTHEEFGSQQGSIIQCWLHGEVGPISVGTHQCDHIGC